MNNQNTRNLVVRFFGLYSSQRREVSLRFGIIDDADMKTPESERYIRALRKAKELGLLERLGQEIEGFEALNSRE